MGRIIFNLTFSFLCSPNTEAAAINKNSKHFIVLLGISKHSCFKKTRIHRLLVSKSAPGFSNDIKHTKITHFWKKFLSGNLELSKFEEKWSSCFGLRGARGSTPQRRESSAAQGRPLPRLRTHCLLLEHARPPLFARRHWRLLRRRHRGRLRAPTPLLHPAGAADRLRGRPNASTAFCSSSSLSRASRQPEMRLREGRGMSASSLGAAAGSRKSWR